MDGISDNVDKAEKAKIVGQVAKFGEMFAAVDDIKKGDVMHMDGLRTERQAGRRARVGPESGWGQAGGPLAEARIAG